MKQTIHLNVNGTAREDAVEPRTLLVHYLRETLGLTGTHIGCDSSQCGACTVHLDGQAVKSCTMFAVQADGMSVTTIEGLNSVAGACSPPYPDLRSTGARPCCAAPYLLITHPTVFFRKNPQKGGLDSPPLQHSRRNAAGGSSPGAERVSTRRFSR
jgi:carbon-monoxide dehydrogenase small subunit